MPVADGDDHDRTLSVTSADRLVGTDQFGLLERTGHPCNVGADGQSWAPEILGNAAWSSSPVVSFQIV